MVRFTLFVLGLFKWVFNLWGINYTVLEAILKAKLVSDFRRSPGTNNSGGKKQTFAKQLIFFVLIGIMVGLGFFSINDLMLSFTICYAFAMVMLGTTIITEFSSVLFDERDNSILLPKPIDNKTFLVSRLLHIQIYISYIALAMSLVSSVIVAIKFGFGVFVGFFLGMGLATWITLLFTSVLYLLLAKLFNADRFKNIISYVQIVIAILIFGGYQLLPRIMDSETMQQAAINYHWYTYLIPPVWCAAFVKIFFGQAMAYQEFLLFALSLVSAFGGGLLAVRFLSKDFTKVLTASNGKAAVKKDKQKTKKRKMPQWVLISHIEKAGWDFAALYSKRDSKFKQAVYPSFGFLFIMIFVFFKPDIDDLKGSFQAIAESKKYLALIFIGIFGTTSISQLPYTETPEAAWIYKALPLAQTKHLLTGAFKRMMFQFFIPFQIILLAIAFLIWGFPILPQMILGSILMFWVTQITVILQKIELPFTLTRQMQAKGSGTAKMFISMIIMGGVVGVVYLIAMLPVWATFLFYFPFLALIPITFNKIRKSEVTHE